MKCKTCKSSCAWAGKEESEHGKCLVGYTPITNADRIRSMTDEELADYMHRIIANVAGNPEICPSISFLEHWLEQEADEDE